MKSQAEIIADAFRSVAARLEQSVNEGQRSSQIDVEDVINILQSVADELESNLVR